MTSAQKTVSITQSAATFETLTITNKDTSPFGREFNGGTRNYEATNFTAQLKYCQKGKNNSYFIPYYNSTYGTITISPNDNRIITRIVITYSANTDSNATFSNGTSSDPIQGSQSGSTVTWDVNSTIPITYTAKKNNARISSIQVYYGTTN